jgi:hypothetical protein
VPSGGGFDLTTELPIDMTAATGGTGIASNTGNADVYPFLRVSNALGAGSNITEFVVTNATHDQSVHVITDITPGQTLVMDFDALVRAEKGPHVYIDTSSRYGDWQQPRTPLAIRPGDNTFFAEVEGGTPTVRLDWMDALL